MKSILLVLLAPLYSFAQSVVSSGPIRNALIYDELETEKIIEYISTNGQHIKLGDTLRIGKPYKGSRRFSTICSGKNSLAEELIYGVEFLHRRAAADLFIITSIRQRKSNKSGKPPRVLVYGINPLMADYNRDRTIVNYEDAIAIGEVLGLDDKPLSRAEAIEKLKEAKELLELGVITEAEYDLQKERYSKIILN